MSTFTSRRKSDLRIEATRRVADLTDSTRTSLAARLRQRALDLPEVRSAHGLLVFLSVAEEPDTRPLIESLASMGKAVHVPRTEHRDRSLHAHLWPCDLQTLQSGLLQPGSSAPELQEERIDTEIDATVVPGPGFDETGLRLGHGGGYVDRFLARHPVFSVGLAFEAALFQRLPQATHDVPMSALVTEDRVLRPETDPKAALRRWLALDHQEIDGLLRIALADGSFEPSSYARFRERILRHIGIEERILFPAVRERHPTRYTTQFATLRIEHAALTTLLVPTPDRALALEIESLLRRHNDAEECEDGIYDKCLAALTSEVATRVLQASRARAPVRTSDYFDGRGTVRTAEEALAKAGRGVAP